MRAIVAFFNKEAHVTKVIISMYLHTNETAFMIQVFYNHHSQL